MNQISDNCLKKIINFIIDLIKDNKKIIKMINEEDKEFCGIDMDIEKLIKIIGEYRNKNVIERENQKILISYYGNPYLTTRICIESLINNCEISLLTEGICYGLNKTIVKIINDVLEEYKIPNQIIIQDNLIEDNTNNLEFNKVICLGDSNSYMNLRKIPNIDIKYVPLFDTSVYYDSEKYEELAESIRKYAEKNYYEIEIFDETEEIDEVIYTINHSLEKYCNILLSNDINNQEKYKKEIKSKNIYINENPFSKFEIKVPEELWI